MLSTYYKVDTLQYTGNCLGQFIKYLIPAITQTLANQNELPEAVGFPGIHFLIQTWKQLNNQM